MPEGVHIITYLTQIRFGFGALSGLSEDRASLNMARPMLVSDRGIAAAGILDYARAALGVPPAAEFLDTPSNPTEGAAIDAARMYAEAECDGLVAVGGGSSLDLAKAVSILVGHGGSLGDYALIRGGLARITAKVAPVIAIPTTAGTGSEVGRAALVTLADGQKLGLVSPHLIPKRAICDPELTLGLPAGLTAATGMDALSHCVETYLSPRINPPAEAIALDGLGRIWRNLPRAVLDRGDREARWQVMMGALQGGMTFQKGLGAIHGLSHALGGYKGASLHHGLLNAVLLPPVLRLNEGSAPEKYGEMQRVCGLGPKGDLAAAMAGFIGAIGLPPDLKAYNLPEDIVGPMAALAMADHSTATNPKPITQADYVSLFEAIR